MADELSILDVAVGSLVAVLGYLLKRKDEEQSHLIEELFSLHRADADRLHAMELKIASDHYVKAEMDSKFDKLESAMKSGFSVLGNKFDVLSSTLVAHKVQEEINKRE
jgi:hypothetical protein